MIQTSNIRTDLVIAKLKSNGNKVRVVRCDKKRLSAAGMAQYMQIENDKAKAEYQRWLEALDQDAEWYNSVGTDRLNTVLQAYAVGEQHVDGQLAANGGYIDFNALLSDLRYLLMDMSEASYATDESYYGLMKLTRLTEEAMRYWYDRNRSPVVYLDD